MIHIFKTNELCWAGMCLSKTGVFGIFRTVSFSEEVRVIPSKESLSRRQIRALWYSEPTGTRGIGHTLILQILCGKAKERNGDGDAIDVDYDTDSHSFPVSAVLMEQESRRGSGQDIDPAEIAKMYQRCSSHSAVRAQLRATKFERDALEYLCQPSRHGKDKIMLIEETRT
jgi:hypothetical protein